MIIGLSGRAGCGKSTCAARLSVLHGNVVELSFAAKLKEQAAALFGISIADLEVMKRNPDRMIALGTHVEGLGFVAHKGRAMTVRQFLQKLGTEAGRDVFGPDHWIDLVLPIRGCREFQDPGTLFVVSDVRFENEARRIRDLGGHVVSILGLSEPDDSHESERPLMGDYMIKNTRRLDSFAALDQNLRVLLRALNCAPASAGAAAA